MFNVLQNDIYNYADDTAMGCRALTKSELCVSIMDVSKTMISWCNANYMQANPEKFQLITFSNFDDTGSIEVENGVMLKPPKCNKSTGSTHRSSFRTHVASMNEPKGW